jgi:hypothetical protein
MRTLIRLIKFLFPIALIAGAVYGALYFMAPILSVEISTSQLTYDQIVTFRTTIHNPSLFPKEIATDATAPDVVILLDGATPPKETTKPTGKIKLKPFSSQTVEHTVIMRRTPLSSRIPQIVTGETAEVQVTDGQHAVHVSWGGRQSLFLTTFGIR